jgi:hypothetical protein
MKILSAQKDKKNTPTLWIDELCASQEDDKNIVKKGIYGLLGNILLILLYLLKK